MRQLLALVYIKRSKHRLFFPHANDEYLAQLGLPQKHLPLIAAIEIIGTTLYMSSRAPVFLARFG